MPLMRYLREWSMNVGSIEIREERALKKLQPGGPDLRLILLRIDLTESVRFWVAILQPPTDNW
jgi:hypothetical protein